MAEGLAALSLLIVLQFIITWLSVRSKTVDKLVKADSAILVKDGELQEQAMKNERVTEDEIRSALRQGHWDKLEDVASVVLETNGKMNVVYKSQSHERNKETAT